MGQIVHDPTNRCTHIDLPVCHPQKHCPLSVSKHRSLPHLTSKQNAHYCPDLHQQGAFFVHQKRADWTTEAIWLVILSHAPQKINVVSLLLCVMDHNVCVLWYLVCPSPLWRHFFAQGNPGKFFDFLGGGRGVGIDHTMKWHNCGAWIFLMTRKFYVDSGLILQSADTLTRWR